MHRHILLLLLLLATVGLHAQPDLPGFTAADTLRRPCPGDSLQEVLSFVGWEAYQTLNDHWDGPRDTTVCIELARVATSGWVYPAIAVDQIDAQRPVFLRVLFDEDNVLPLQQDDLYTFSFDPYIPGAWDTGDCPGGPCTGAMAAVRIPDADSMGTDIRWYETGYVQLPSSSFPINLCVPTEKFDTNDLREFVVSMKALDPQPGQEIFFDMPPVIDALVWGSLVRLTDQTASQYRSGVSNYFFSGWLEEFLVMHADTTYPDGNNVYHLDLGPVPDPGTPTTVNAHLGPYTTFQFQPFTQLRGALVAGSDSVRHPLTVVNDGGDLCMGWTFVELIWEPGSRYVHRAGHVEFAGRNSCFMFQPGSTLEVAPGSSFHYGREGRGMLALIEGSHLRIGQGGELVMHGTLVIKEAPEQQTPLDWHLTLGAGQRLRFAPGSGIHNAFSIDGRMKLVVTLDGGSIDISGLSPEDREKVVVVELPPEDWSALRILGNPAGEELLLAFGVREAGTLQLRIVDSMGRLVAERTQAVHAGENRANLSLARMRHGAYLLEALYNGERRVLRFIKE